MKANQDQKIISSLLSGKAPKKYEGKEVVVQKGEIYILPSNDKGASNLLNSLIKKHSGIVPTLVSVPKHGTYILIHK